MLKRLIALAGLGLAACGGAAELKIDDARYRAPLVDGGTGVAYFSITSPAADRIVGVSSPQAQAVEIHESTSAGGMAGMHEVANVDLPAGETVTFGPGGLHLMVISPQPTASGATFPIQIDLESGRSETISFSAAADAS
jgi:copper(I)-binding protein